MRTVKAIYQAEWDGKSLAQVDALMATMPISGRVDTLNWAAYPTAPDTTFTLAYTDTMLFVRYEVKGEVPLATKIHDLEPVNEDACVEIFIGNKDNTRYWNLEFNAAGVCNASHRKSRKEDVVRLTAEELHSIQRYAQTLPLTRESEGASWSLLVGIPLSLIALDPKEEHTRRANIYKCGDKTPMKHYASWNPILSETPAFHLPEYFGEINF